MQPSISARERLPSRPDEPDPRIGTKVKSERPFRSVVLLRDFVAESAGEHRAVAELLKEAEQFLTSHAWCPGIRQSFVGFAVGEVVGVFLFELTKPLGTGDEFLWVVVGDLPSAYFVVDRTESPREALERYCELMRAWVDAIEQRGSLTGVYPVQAPPTLDNARLLASRLEFIEETLLPVVPD